jgi:integrase
MTQQGQVFRLASVARDGSELWAYRYRTGGRQSRRIQRGGFSGEEDARAALERTLEKVRSANGRARVLTLAELVEQYLAQHEVSSVTLEKLRWLLTHAVAAFGERRLDSLQPHEIAAWRMTIRTGYRFEATQALRQVLQRAVVWGMLDVNPAKQGVENPQRRATEKRPFESWDEVESVAATLRGPQGPMVIFAAATGLRPGEWVALEQRDIDREARVVYVRRSFSKGRLKCTKTEASVRAVPLQAIALSALDRLPVGAGSDLLFPGSQRRLSRPAQLSHPRLETGSDGRRHQAFRRIYDLRHTFATFALRAGISTFDLSRYMGASLTMIDRHYGHLVRDGREHAIQLLDMLHASAVDAGGRLVDAEDTSSRHSRQRKGPLSRR